MPRRCRGERGRAFAVARPAPGPLGSPASMVVCDALYRPLAITLLAAGVLGLSARGSALPAPLPDEPEPPADAEAGAPQEPWRAWETSIQRQPVCVGSTVTSAGELGDVLYYRSARRDDGRLSVGYYAFFSEERPWGNNWLTWTLLPALVLDVFYTHSLFFAPGLQAAAYGKGDVEGFRIVYDVDERGRLTADHGVADSGRHTEVRLARSDLLSIEPGRPTVYSIWWSHQLGGRGAKSSELVVRRCYGPASIRALPPRIARDFRLDRRALPARVVPAAALLRSGPGAAAERRVVEREQHDGAEDRHEEASARLVRGIEPDQPADEPSEQRAGDADQRRHHEPAGVAPRGQQLGDHADDEAK